MAAGRWPSAYGLGLDFDHFDFALVRLLRPSTGHDAAAGLEAAGSAATTRSSSVPSAGPRRCPTTFRSGARCCSSAASSINTVNLRPGAADARRPLAAGRGARRAISTSTWSGRTPKASIPRSADACSPAPTGSSWCKRSVMTRIGRGPQSCITRLSSRSRRPAPRHLTSATKSNGISITMPYWDERVEAVAEAISGGELGQVPHRHPDRAFRAQPRPVRRHRGVRTSSATSSATSAPPAPARSGSRRPAT